MICASIDHTVNLTVVPDTGLWSGTGVNSLGVFTPSNVGAGDHKIYYTYNGLCGNLDSIEIHVDIVHDATIATPDTTVCENDPIVTLLVAETGGTWFINDTTAGNELGGTSFDPSAHSPAVYTLIYLINDPCGDLDTVFVTVNPRKNAAITASKTVYCEDDPSVVFTSAEVGGTWSGNGINSVTGEFDPSTSGTGTFKVYYTLSDPCGAIDSVELTVNPVRDGTINTPSDTMSYCVLDPNPQFTVNEVGGTWNNGSVIQSGLNIEINLDANSGGLGVVTNERIIYTIAGPCGSADTIWVTTTNKLDATITQVGPYCDSDGPVSLNVIDASSAAKSRHHI